MNNTNVTPRPQNPHGETRKVIGIQSLKKPNGTIVDHLEF